MQINDDFHCVADLPGHGGDEDNPALPPTDHFRQESLGRMHTPEHIHSKLFLKRHKMKSAIHTEEILSVV